MRRLDPEKLFKLKSGVKRVEQILLPDWLFQSVHGGYGLNDMWIQSVAISLPCTVGPNTKVDLKLTLNNHGTDLVAYKGASDARIITSTAQSDTGRFDPNPGGPQYLPFENANVHSQWTLELPDRLEFDPATINDVIFHIRYTAVPGDAMAKPVANGKYAVSLRHDFYDRWLTAKGVDGSLDLSGAFPSVATEKEELLSRSPYIYANNSNFKYSRSTDSGTPRIYALVVKDQDSPPKVIEFTGNALSVSNGKITHNSEEVIDIIAYVSAS